MNEFNDYITGQQEHGSLNIEITHRCLLQCSQCLRSNLTNNKPENRERMKNRLANSGDMPLDDFRKMCDFGKHMALCGQISDPIYHEQFYDILKICKEYPDRAFKIHTAAHQKNIEWYKTAFELTGPNVKWIFGIDGTVENSSTYRINQNTQLVYDAMMLAAKMGLNVQWQFIVFKYNEHQINNARNLCKEHGIVFYLVYTDRSDGNIELPSKKYRAQGPVKEYRS